MLDEIQETPTTVVEESNDGEVKEQTPSTEVADAINRVRQELSQSYMGVIAEKESRNKELERILTAKIDADKVKDAPVLDNDVFLTNPNEAIKHFARIVEEATTKQIKPLQDAVDEMQTAGKVNTLVNRVKSANPNVSALIDVYGPEIRAIALQGGKKASELTDRDVQQAVVMIPGLIMTGALENRMGNVTPKNEEKVTGPNIRPSSPPVPKGNNDPKNLESKLTEQELVVLKHSGMSAAEYIALRDATPDMRTWPKKVEAK